MGRSDIIDKYLSFKQIFLIKVWILFVYSTDYIVLSFKHKTMFLMLDINFIKYIALEHIWIVGTKTAFVLCLIYKQVLVLVTIISMGCSKKSIIYQTIKKNISHYLNCNMSFLQLTNATGGRVIFTHVL